LANCLLAELARETVAGDLGVQIMYGAGKSDV
jgi:hypothetical protein